MHVITNEHALMRLDHYLYTIIEKYAFTTLTYSINAHEVILNET